MPRLLYRWRWYCQGYSFSVDNLRDWEREQPRSATRVVLWTAAQWVLVKDTCARFAEVSLCYHFGPFNQLFWLFLLASLYLPVSLLSVLHFSYNADSLLMIILLQRQVVCHRSHINFTAWSNAIKYMPIVTDCWDIVNGIAKPPVGNKLYYQVV